MIDAVAMNYGPHNLQVCEAVLGNPSSSTLTLRLPHSLNPLCADPAASDTGGLRVRRWSQNYSAAVKLSERSMVRQCRPQCGREASKVRSVVLSPSTVAAQ